MKMSPDVTLSSPASMRNVVVLPQPDGPSSTMNSPSRTSSAKSLTTHAPPNVFVTLRNSIPISALHCSHRQPAHEILLQRECEHQNRNYCYRRRRAHHAPLDLVLRHASCNSYGQRHRRVGLRQHKRKQKLIPRNDQTK